MGRCAFRRGEGCTVMKAILQCLLGTGQPNQYGLNASRFNESENDQWGWNWNVPPTLRNEMCKWRPLTGWEAQKWKHLRCD